MEGKEFPSHPESMQPFPEPSPSRQGAGSSKQCRGNFKATDRFRMPGSSWGFKVVSRRYDSPRKLCVGEGRHLQSSGCPGKPAWTRENGSPNAHIHVKGLLSPLFFVLFSL